MTASSGSRRTIISGSAIVFAAALAYGNSGSGVFVLDDEPSILDNASIRHLWPICRVLAPAHGGMTVSGRPLVNLSLALNYALGGLNPFGYHLFNLLTHMLAGLALFGVARRTLERIGKCGPSNPGCIFPALAIALLWALHPLQTESVTYVIQRAEAMMGLFYLLTLYCFIRYAESGEGLAARTAPAELNRSPLFLAHPAKLWRAALRGGRRQAMADRTRQDAQEFMPLSSGSSVSGSPWAWLSIVCCLFGMACKEVMVSAPLIVLLYDRTFFSGSFGKAWGQRRRFYLCLGATWVLLAWLVGQSGNRGGTSGWGTGVSAGAYWLTQFPALTRYLTLSVWPHPLIFDYGTIWVRSFWTVLPSAFAVALLAVATAYLLLRRKAAGFLGACFFAVLAPSSLMPGNRQVMAEHRMYLALAPVVAAAVMGINYLAETGLKVGRARWARRLPRRPQRARPTMGIFFLFALPLALGLLTYRRNRDYLSDLVLYCDTVAKLPGNAFAQVAYGLALSEAGQLDEAIAHYQSALLLNPRLTSAYNDLGLALFRKGRLAEAIDRYRQALRLDPEDAEVRNNLGVVLYHQGKFEEALAQYREALRLKPEYPEAWDNLGNLTRREGRTGEAIQAYARALQLEPGFSIAANNLGVALAETGRLPEAIVRLRQAVQANSDYPEAENDLGLALIRAGRPDEALPYLRRAIRLKPTYANAHYNLGLALKNLGKTGESAAEFESATRLQALGN